jgi:hypothetical protein
MLNSLATNISLSKPPLNVIAHYYQHSWWSKGDFYLDMVGPTSRREKTFLFCYMVQWVSHKLLCTQGLDKLTSTYSIFHTSRNGAPCAPRGNRYSYHIYTCEIEEKIVTIYIISMIKIECSTALVNIRGSTALIQYNIMQSGRCRITGLAHVTI